MIEKLLALAPKTANCKLHFFVPFNFRAYSFLPVLQILIKFSNTSHEILHRLNWVKIYCPSLYSLKSSLEIFSNR